MTPLAFFDLVVFLGGAFVARQLLGIVADVIVPATRWARKRPA